MKQKRTGVFAILQRGIGHNSPQTRVACCGFLDELHLLEKPAPVNEGLDKHHGLDGQVAGIVGIVLDAERACHGGIVCLPSDGITLGVPDMQVRIDDREIWH